jgi:hypothetical protein
MAAKKSTARKETLLTTVARKLGHAAGTLTKATQELTENLSAIPENVATGVRESANVGAPVGRSRARTQHPRKKIRRVTRTQPAARTKSKKVPKSKSPRSGPRVSSLKK